MKKKILLPLLVAPLLFACSDSTDTETVPVKEPTKIEKMESRLMAHNEQMKGVVTSIKADYETIVSKLHSSSEASISGAISGIKANVAELAKGAQEQEALYKKECVSDELKGGDSCNNIKKGIVDIRNKIKGKEVELSNIQGNADSKLKTLLAKYEADYSNKLKALGAQVGMQFEDLK